MKITKKTENKLTEVYDLIKKFIQTKGYPPTLRELMDKINVNSTSTVKYYLDKLEEKQLIKRSGNKNRAIELTETITKPDISPVFYNSSSSLTKIPVLGEVAAGTPILAVENYDEVYEFSENIFSKRGELFILTVKGDSMVNAGIFNKDKIVVKKQNYANNTDIVVAMLNGSATVKRFYKENGQIRLQPENDYMKPIYCVDVDILGKVVGLIRNY
ncbi:MAG: transcriptional repressor LexA [Clostridia bacterium]|nr:transcriptional repressor LexA [Clostridia bacterium]